MLLNDKNIVIVSKVQYSSRVGSMSHCSLTQPNLTYTYSSFAIAIYNTHNSTSISELTNDHGITSAECCLTQYRS